MNIINDDQPVVIYRYSQSSLLHGKNGKNRDRKPRLDHHGHNQRDLTKRNKIWQYPGKGLKGKNI